MEFKNQSDRSFQHRDSTPPVMPNAAYTQSPKKKESSFLSEVIWFAVVAFVIVLPIRFFIAQPFIVSGASMETTFSTGEYLIVDQLTYRMQDPERGDVIVFRYPRNPSKFFIKRIIGVPGDTVEIDGTTVTIVNTTHPEGVVLDEPYISSMSAKDALTESLGEGEYFVMGDNRDSSSDSRDWGILRSNNIIGQAFLRLFPFSKIDVDPGEYPINLAE